MPVNAMLRAAFFLLCGVAALVPAWHPEPHAAAVAGLPPQWPTEFEGRALTPLPPGPGARFASAFPGEIRECTDGRRDFVLRWVTTPTRRLHSSADCLRASGFATVAGPVWRDLSGGQWATFSAARGSARLQVRERITDLSGQHWSDTSAWYWSALLGRTQGPWLAITLVENE